MTRYWKYVLVAVLMFLFGTATVVAAPPIKQFVISNEDGERFAEVSPDNRLLVEAAGTNPSDIVNLFPSIVDGGAGPFDCTNANAFIYPVPGGNTLLITDMLVVSSNPGTVSVATNSGVFMVWGLLPINLTTPLVIPGGDQLCIARDGSTTSLLISGVLIPAP